MAHTHQLIQDIHKELPLEDSVLADFKNNLFSSSIEVFHNSCSILDKEQDKVFMNKLSVKIDEEFVALLKLNKYALSTQIENYFNFEFKAKVNKNLKNGVYASFEDYDKEVQLFKHTLMQDLGHKDESVELLVDKMFLRFNGMVYKEISSTNQRHTDLELAAFKERFRIAEKDLQIQREEMSKAYTQLGDKINYLEEDRIKLVAENEVLSQRLKNKDHEKDTALSISQQKYDE